MFNDLRIGLRMLLAQPGFTLIAVLAIALGIGATTLVFSVVNAVLLRPLPFPDAERVVRIGERHPGSTALSNLSYAAFLDLGNDIKSIESISAARFFTANLTDGNQPQQVNTLLVSARYLSALKIQPQLGRIFAPQDDVPGAAKVAMLSDALWKQRYGGDPGVVGRSIRIGSDSVTVIGIMPDRFRAGYPFSGQYDLWVPLVPTGDLRANRRSHLLGVLGRLKSGITLQQAQSELGELARGIEQASPGIDPDMGLDVVGLRDQVVAPIRQALIVFLFAVGLLLLIACANVANLLLARVTVREKEMAIRAALGAGRLRLIRQSLTESAMLALIGGACGVLFAMWGTRIVASLNPSTFPRINEVTIDTQVLIFTLLISLATGILFGLAPVIQLPRSGLTETLKDASRSIAGGGKRWLRHVLVVSEVALAITLVVCAGLLINSFVRLMQVNRGFDSSNVLTVNLNLPGSKYRTGETQTLVLRQILERVRSAPEVSSAGVVSSLPFGGGPATDFEIEGQPVPDKNLQPIADIRIVDEGYFNTLRIPLRAGRFFNEHDLAGATQIMMINEEMARQYWPNENPIGRRVTMKDWGPPLTGQIVGIAGDVRADGLDSRVRPMIYWPYPQFPGIFNNLVVRTEGDPLKIVSAVQAQVWSVDRELPLTRVQTMDDVIAGSVAPRRFNMLLLGIFAALALALATVGIYGVISYTVVQRRHEMGVRIALGARPVDVVKLVVKQAMLLTLFGIGLGLAAAFGLSRLMSNLLYDVHSFDPLTFASAALLLALIALLACLIPARRATRVDPLQSLRRE